MKTSIAWALATFLIGLVLCLAWAATMWFLYALLNAVGVL